MFTKKMFGDLCLMTQIVFASISGTAQALKLLESTEGIIQTWFELWGLFVALNLYLAFAAYRVKPGRAALQTIVSYSVWMLMVVACLCAIFYRGAQWNDSDSLTMVFAVTGIAVTLDLAWCMGISIRDPMVKGWIAVFCLGLPQLMMAVNMLMTGSARGLSEISLWASHITVLTRLMQLYLSNREAGWDRNRKASILSEIANYGSWVIVTFVYYYLLP